MDALPPFEEVSDRSGADWAAKLPVFLDDAYQIYLDTIANAALTFRGLPVRCQFRPISDGKGFGFWHLMQEGRVEEKRTPDLARCRRIRWIAWIIRAAERGDPRVRVFPQQVKWSEDPWALWMPEEKYLVILWERSDYFLLKTAFLADKSGKISQLERDWKVWQSANP